MSSIQSLETSKTICSQQLLLCQQLNKAILDGNSEEVEKLLEKGAIADWNSLSCFLFSSLDAKLYKKLAVSMGDHFLYGAALIEIHVTRHMKNSRFRCAEINETYLSPAFQCSVYMDMFVMPRENCDVQKVLEYAKKELNDLARQYGSDFMGLRKLVAETQRQATTCADKNSVSGKGVVSDGEDEKDKGEASDAAPRAPRRLGTSYQ